MGRYKLPRDFRGWAVPQKGTKSRVIYDIMVAERESGESFDVGTLVGCLGMGRNSIHTIIHRIRNPKARKR